MDKFGSRQAKGSKTVECQSIIDLEVENVELGSSNRPHSSKVWRFFKKSADSKLAKCLSCRRAYKTSGNTSNLADHLKRCHSKSNEESAPTTERSVKQFFTRSLEYENHSQHKKELDETLAIMIAKDFQSFSIVNDEGFRKLIKLLDSKYVIPSKTLIRNSIMPKLFLNAKQKLNVMLNETNHVAITCDMWSSRELESYLTVTCHFLTKNFDLKSVVLSTKPLLTQVTHSAENIASSLNDIFVEWDITQKIVCVATDNAKVMVIACDNLDIQQLGCFAHSLNLTVQDGFKLGVVRSITTKCKDIVRFFKSSTIARELLNKEQDSAVPYKLVQEVQTRWNSTFYMIQRILKLIDPIRRCLLKLKKAPIPLSIEEVHILKGFEKILAGFDEVTKEVSGSSYVTISLIIPMSHGSYLNSLEIKKMLNTEEGINLCTQLTQSFLHDCTHTSKLMLSEWQLFWTPGLNLVVSFEKKQGNISLENELITSCLNIANNTETSGELVADVSDDVSASGHVLSFLEKKISERQTSHNLDVMIYKRQYIQ